MSTIQEQFSSPEMSDELNTALAAGRWWAIVEVAYPISEVPENWDFTWGTIEAEGTSCTLSMVFGDVSVNTKSLRPGFTNATLKTTKQWRQKTTSVPAGFEEKDLTSSLILRDKPDATLTTIEHQRKQKQKKPQRAPVFAGPEKAQWRDLTSFRVFGNAFVKAEAKHSAFSDITSKTGEQKWRRRQKEPQQTSVPAGSSQGAPAGCRRGPPVPTGSQHRGKLRIPDHLTQHLQKAAFDLGKPVSSVPPKEPPRSAKPQERAPVPAPKVLTYSPKKAPETDRDPEGQNVKIPKLLGQDVQKPQTSSLEGTPMLARSKQRGKLKIPNYLTKHLQKAALELETSVLTIYPPKAPIPAMALQKASVSAPKVLAYSPHTPTMADRVPGKQKSEIPEQLGQELQKKPPMPAKSPEEQECPQQQGTAGPANVSIAPVPYSGNKGAPIPSWMAKKVPVHAKAPHEARVPTDSPQQDKNFGGILKQNRQKWREQQHRLWRQQKTPKPLHETLALGNADVDKHLHKKKQQMAIKTRDQQSETASLKQMENLCNIFMHLYL